MDEERLIAYVEKDLTIRATIPSLKKDCEAQWYHIISLKFFSHLLTIIVLLHLV